MPTLVFVHGTGVRSGAYEQAMNLVRRGVDGHDLMVADCLWGDRLGARLHGNGASIPPDLPHLAITVATPEDEQVALWSLLYQDPGYELRSLAGVGDGRGQGSAFVPGRRSPAEMLHERVTILSRDGPDSERTRSALAKIGFEPMDLREAFAAVKGSSAYRLVSTRLQEPLTPYRLALARAIVAQAYAARIRSDMTAQPDHFSSAAGLPSLDGEPRDELVAAVAAELGPSELSIGAALLAPVSGLAERWATSRILQNRREISNTVYPGLGDILLYQTRGQPVRDFIRERVETADPPVLLLAHSLGGIMCVDLLVQCDLSDRVQLLVTVGSQTPLFYEMGTLTSLEWGAPLPAHVPRWLNIFDPRDFLSYVGGRVFPGRVSDRSVNSRQPFPQSHSAYWTNPRTWQLMLAEWTGAVR
jgi:hypothetical protein